MDQPQPELTLIGTDLTLKVQRFTQAYTTGLLLALAVCALVVFGLGTVMDRQASRLAVAEAGILLGDAARLAGTPEQGSAGAGGAEIGDLARRMDDVVTENAQQAAIITRLGAALRRLSAAATPGEEAALRREILDLASSPALREGEVSMSAGELASLWKLSIFALLPVGMLLVGFLTRHFHSPLTETLTCWKDEFISAGQQAQRSILFDQMTGLPTRRSLLLHMNELRAGKDGGRLPLALLHFDFLRFREINNTLNHETGDRVLLRLSQVLNLAAARDDVVARIAGDEFVVLTHGEEAEAQKLAGELQKLVTAPIDIDGKSVRLDAAIGIAVDKENADAETLLGNAEIALSHAKSRPNGGIETYTEALRNSRDDRRMVERGLRQALAGEEIEPFFQPQIDAKSGDVVGFEALVRWRHPRRGVLRPQEFLPVAEQTGLIRDISRVMVRKSLATLSYWHKQGLLVPQISLNFTAGELREPGFVDTLLFDVDRAGLRPQNICVELLESAMIEDADDPVVETLARLSKAGFLVELDDFGTGHASLANLRNIRVNGMKIDRSFVSQMQESEQKQKLTHAMLSLAGSLQIGSLAEGVETEAEREMLIAMGCERLQGFGIAKPMSRDDATAWLRNYQRGKAAPDALAAQARAV